MRKRVTTALAVGLVALIGVFVWQVSQQREPVYNGKRLSEWLKASAEERATAASTSRAPHGTLDIDTTIEADEAVRHAGTNAIPTLLRMLRVSDSPLKLKLLDLAQRQHLIKIKYTPAAYWNGAAAEGFRVLGGKAQSAVPALIEIVNQNISQPSKNSTIYALDLMGPSAKQAVPALLLWVTNTNSGVRSWAAVALGDIHAEPDRVVPSLVKLLNDPDSNVRENATSALKKFDAEAAAKAGIK
jgi:hypothetical protein